MTSVGDLPDDEELGATSRAVEMWEDTAQQVGCGAEMGVAGTQEEMGAGGQTINLRGSAGVISECNEGEEGVVSQRRGTSEIVENQRRMECPDALRGGVDGGAGIGTHAEQWGNSTDAAPGAASATRAFTSSFDEPATVMDMVAEAGLAWNEWVGQGAQQSVGGRQVKGPVMKFRIDETYSRVDCVGEINRRINQTRSDPVVQKVGYKGGEAERELVMDGHRSTGADGVDSGGVLMRVGTQQEATQGVGGPEELLHMMGGSGGREVAEVVAVRGRDAGRGKGGEREGAGRGEVGRG